MDVGLLQYISTQLKQGIPPEEITQMLMSRGWPLEAIDAGFKYIATHPNQVENHLQVFSGKLRSPLELAHAAFVFLKNRFIPILIINSLPSLFSVISVVFFSLYMSYLTGTEETVQQTVKVMNMETTVKLSEIPFGILMPIFIFLSVFIFGWTQTALYALIVKKDRAFPLSEAFHIGLTKLLPFLWVTILFCLFLVTGSFLLIIPGILCIVWFSMAPYIVMNEDIHGFTALMKSKEYVKGKWLAVFGRLIAVILLVSITSSTIGFFLNILSNTADSPVIPILSSIIVFIFSLITAPFTIIYISFIYDDLRVGREATAFQASPRSKIIFWIVLALSTLVVVGTIFTAFGAYHYITSASTDSVKLQQTENIRGALDEFYSNKGYYPASLNELLPEFIRSIPNDPDTKMPYKYTQDRDGQEYSLCTSFAKTTFQQSNCMHSRHATMKINPPSPTSLVLPTMNPSGYPSPTPLPPDFERITHLTALQNGLSQFAADTGGTFPLSLQELEGKYIVAVPKDPLLQTSYAYTKESGREEYKLCAKFDNFSENNSHTICFNSKTTAARILMGTQGF